RRAVRRGLDGLHDGLLLQGQASLGQRCGITQRAARLEELGGGARESRDCLAEFGIRRDSVDQQRKGRRRNPPQRSSRANSDFKVERLGTALVHGNRDGVISVTPVLLNGYGLK